MRLIYKVACLYLVALLSSTILAAPIPKAKVRPDIHFKDGHYRMCWGGSSYVSYFGGDGVYWAMLEDVDKPSVWQGTWRYDKKTTTLHVEEKLPEWNTTLIWSVNLGKKEKHFSGNIYFKGEDTTHIFLKLSDFTNKPKKVEY